MIEKNGKEYKIPDAEIDNIIKNYQDKDGHMTLVWSKKRAVSKPHLLNKKVPYKETLEYPPSFPIPVHNQVYTEKGTTDGYRYFTTKTPGENGRPDTYLPVVLDFSNTRIERDIEIQWFLVYCCPFVENGIAGKEALKRNPKLVPWLRIQLTDVEARDKVKDLTLKNKVDNKILEELPEGNLRDLAAMYRLANPDSEPIDSIRASLIDILAADGRTDPMMAYETMGQRIDSIDSPTKEDEVAAVAERAISAKIVGFVNATSSWAILDKDGNTAEGICRVNGSHLAQKRIVLERHLKANKDDLLKIKKELEEAGSSDEGKTQDKRKKSKSKDK